MSRKSGKGGRCDVESIFDLSPLNVWTLDNYQIAALWKKECSKEGFATKQEKLLNTIHLAFEVVRYDPDDEREAKAYENGEWTSLALRTDAKQNHVAIRPRPIKRLSDLNRQNVRLISVATLLELIDRNFGGGWSAIPQATRDIIESVFDVGTTQLPTSRIHAAGGTLERKRGEGFEVLEITKGTWTEAIYAKKKDPSEYEIDDYEDDEDKRKGRYSEDDDSLDSAYDEEERDEDQDEYSDYEEDREPEEEPIEEELPEDETFFNDYIEDPPSIGDEEVDEDSFMIGENP